MTTMQAPSRNGRVQKSLSHQLDRLDTILDGFAEALQGAVSDAVAASVGAVVRDAVAAAVREVLAVQAVQAAQMARDRAEIVPLMLPAVVAPPARPSRWARFRAEVASAARCLRAAVARRVAPVAGTVVGRLVRAAVTTVSLARFGIALVRGDRRAGRWGALAAVVAGLACGLGDPLVAALVGGAAVGLLTAAAVMTAPLWRPWLGMRDEYAAADGKAVG